jgi:hypothetical protein
MKLGSTHQPLSNGSIVYQIRTLFESFNIVNEEVCDERFLHVWAHPSKCCAFVFLGVTVFLYECLEAAVDKGPLYVVLDPQHRIL